MQKARIVATGYYLPAHILTNTKLEEMVDTTDEWITTRTGIKQRHIAEPQEASSDMGIAAARAAMEKAAVKPTDIDAVICATITPDHAFPSTACLVQKGLRLVNAFAFDVSAACSGFIYSLSIAESLIRDNKANTVLVIATEKLSSITDWEDRATCVLFGDGAGAAVVTRSEGERGILSSYLKADGNLGDLLMLPAGGSRKPSSYETIQHREHFLKMKGNDVFKHAVLKMVDAATNALERAHVSAGDVALFIPHQANLRIVHAIAKRFNIADERIFVNLHKTGNTSAASIAIALSQAQEEGRLKENDIVLLVGFGAGFTWAGMVVRW